MYEPRNNKLKNKNLDNSIILLDIYDEEGGDEDVAVGGNGVLVGGLTNAIPNSPGCIGSCRSGGSC